MSAIGIDTFNRANQTGFGTASGGGTWTFNGAAQNTIGSIASNKGKCTGSATLTTAWLGSTSADGNVVCRVSCDHTADHAGVVGRATAANTYYRAEINGGNSMSITKLVAGVSTDIATGTFTYATTDLVWVRLVVIGSSIYANFWKDGTTEPSNWSLTATDSSITAAGNWGIKVLLHTATDIVTFDSFSAYTNNALTTEAAGKFYASMLVRTPVEGTFLTRGSTLTTRTRATFINHAGAVTSSNTYVPVMRAFGGTVLIFNQHALVTQSQTTFIISKIPFVSDSFPGCDGVDVFAQGVG